MPKKKRGCGLQLDGRKRGNKNTKGTNKRSAGDKEEGLSCLTSSRPKRLRTNDTPSYKETKETEVELSSILSLEGRRILIAGIFERQFNCESDLTKWHGRNGIVSQIKKICKVPERTDIDYILKDAIQCKRSKKQYLGTQATGTPGRKAILDVRSGEGTIIAQALRRGLSRPNVLLLVQNHRREEGLPSVTQAAIDGCMKKMKAVKRTVGKRPQGSHDVNSKICRARYLFAMQNAIRFGVDKKNTTVKTAIDKFLEDYRLKYGKHEG